MVDLSCARSNDAATGLLRLRNFLHDCAGSAPLEEAERVREALILLPEVMGTGRASSRMVEALLASGAGLCAVLTIIGPDTPFMISRGASQTCIATVLVNDDEMVSEGTTVALALLAAHVSACLVGLERWVAAADLPSQPLCARLH